MDNVYPKSAWPAVAFAAMILVCLVIVSGTTFFDLVPHYRISTAIIAIVLLVMIARRGVLSFPVVLYVIIFFPALTPFYAWDIREKLFFSQAAAELQGSIQLVSETVWVFAVAALAYGSVTIPHPGNKVAETSWPVFVVGKITAVILGCLLVLSAYIIDPGPTILTASYTDILAGRFKNTQATVFFELAMGAFMVSLFLFARHHRWIFWASVLIAFTWLFLHVRRVEFFGLLLVLLFWMRASHTASKIIAVLVIAIGLQGVMGEIRIKGIFSQGTPIKNDSLEIDSVAGGDHEEKYPSKGEIHIEQGGRHIELFEFEDGTAKTYKELVSNFHSNKRPKAPGNKVRSLVNGLETIRGTSTGELLSGSDDNEYIRGMGGTDTILGGDGDDVLDAGRSSQGWQLLSGGNGNDTYVYATWHRNVKIPRDAETSISGETDRLFLKDLNFFEVDITVEESPDDAADTVLKISWSKETLFTMAALPGGAGNIFLSGLHLVNLRVNQLLPGSQSWTMREWFKALVPGTVYKFIGLAPAKSEHEAIYENLKLDYIGGMPLVAVYFLNGGYLLVVLFGVMHGLFSHFLEHIHQRHFIPNSSLGGNFVMFAMMVFLFYQFRYQWYNPQTPVRAMEIGVLLYLSLRFFGVFRVKLFPDLKPKK